MTKTTQKCRKEVVKLVRYTVRQARTLRNITQRAMARIIGITERTYISKEQNPENFKMWEAEKFLDAVGLEYKDVIFHA